MVTVAAPKALDYGYSDTNHLPETAVARWDANLSAIRLLKDLDESGGQATPAQQEVLARYSGFGDSAFGQAFQSYPSDRAWRDRKEELAGLVSEDEYRAIARSRLNAFYTSPAVVRTMWKGLQDLGADQIENPRILEPSAGSGRFLAMQPPAMAARSKRTAVELDKTTGALLKHLYPETEVWNTGFEAAPLPNESYDLAISNVPFGNYGVHDPEYLSSGRKYLTNSIHNYFFSKTLDKLAPGGMLAFVTTHHTLDAAKARQFREYLSGQADLVGAVRLPERAFPDTDVVTDIIYLRKRKDGEEPGDDSWVGTSEISAPTAYGKDTKEFQINKYFVQNPGMVLGQHSAEGSMYRGDSYTVLKDPGQPIEPQLTAAAARIGQSALKVNPSRTASPPAARARVVEASGPPGTARPVKPADQARLRQMEGLRDGARDLLRLEREGGNDDILEVERAKLREQYQQFVGQYRELNDTPNRKLAETYLNDPLLMALESYDRPTETWRPADIFSRRVVGAKPDRAVASVADAMSVSFNESGNLDFQLMGNLVGKEPGEVRRELAEEQLIFHNPVGGWEPASEYLTGRVREKLTVAEQVATRNPAYQPNVDALRNVQPADVPAGDITTNLGAPWIPARDVNQWVKERFRPSLNYRRGGENWFHYSDEIGAWSAKDVLDIPAAIEDAEWGTSKIKASKILLNTLQGKPITVTKPNPNPEDDRRVPDPEGTLEAREKATAMQQDFAEWVWQNPERAERLARVYNDTHNATRPRIFDGSHQTYPGMAVQWQQQMREHQDDAIFRVVNDGTALLAHEVGFGKTAVMVAANQERRRLGLTNKAIFVVPKATHRQFVSQYQEIYPDAKLLTPGPEDFKPKSREAFLSRIATSDWDGVVLSTEQFQNIPVSPTTERKWVNQQLGDLRSALENMETSDGRKSPSQKDVEKKIASMETKLENLLHEINEGRDKRAINFENLGVDQLYVDEADRYKNLPFATSRGNIKGLPNSESKRAWDMFLKTQYIQSLGDKQSGSFAGNGVVFATGTPIANTIAETWTMMRYLQLPELRRRGVQHFDPWATTYATTKTDLEQTPQGQYKPTERFSQFVNMPELSALFQNVTDVRVASEVPEMLAAQPRLKDENGEPKRTTVVVPSTSELQTYMRYLRQRVEKLGPPEPGADNMLEIAGDAKKAAIDVRLVMPDAAYNPNAKIPTAARKIAQIYREEEADRGTQLVFLDMVQPKTAKRALRGGDEDAEPAVPQGEEATADEQRAVNHLYQQLKEHLIEQGVAADKIAFIQDYKTDAKRKTLFEKVNDGEIRVVVGHTETFGVGVNVQERAAALHHLDVPWRPRDIEQREGRVIRQGNEVYGPKIDKETREVVNPGRGVQIYNYVTERSFDEFMWQAVEVKAMAIKAIMKRNMTVRTMEDIDPLVLGAAEAKALASGNPLVLRAERLRHQANTLRLERASHRNQIEKAGTQVRRLETMVENYHDSLPKMEQDLRLSQAGGDKFNITISGKRYDKRPDAGAGLKETLEGITGYGTEQDIGEYKGFRLLAVRTDYGHQLILENPASGIPYRSGTLEKDDLNPAGLATRIDNLVKGIPKTLESTRARLAEGEQSLEIYRTQLDRPFAKAQDLLDTENELTATMIALRDSDKEDSPATADGGTSKPGGGGESSPASSPASEASVGATAPPDSDRQYLGVGGARDFKLSTVPRDPLAEPLTAEEEEPDTVPVAAAPPSPQVRILDIEEQIKDKPANKYTDADWELVHELATLKRENEDAEPIAVPHTPEDQPAPLEDSLTSSALTEPEPIAPPTEPAQTEDGPRYGVTANPEGNTFAVMDFSTGKSMDIRLESQDVADKYADHLNATGQHPSRKALKQWMREAGVSPAITDPDFTKEPFPSANLKDKPSLASDIVGALSRLPDDQLIELSQGYVGGRYSDMAHDAAWTLRQRQEEEMVSPDSDPEPVDLTAPEPVEEAPMPKHEVRAEYVFPEDPTRHELGDMPIGTKVYYTGDVANQSAWAEVVGEDNGAVVLRMENGRTQTVFPQNIGKVYEGTASPRYVTEDAYRAWKTEMMAKLVPQSSPRTAAPSPESAQTADFAPEPTIDAAPPETTPEIAPVEGINPSRAYEQRLVAGMFVGDAKEELRKNKQAQQDLENRIERSESPDEQSRAFWQEDLANTRRHLAELEALPSKQRQKRETAGTIAKLKSRIGIGEGYLADMQSDPTQIGKWRAEIERFKQAEPELRNTLEDKLALNAEARRVELAAGDLPGEMWAPATHIAGQPALAMDEPEPAAPGPESAQTADFAPEPTIDTLPPETTPEITPAEETSEGETAPPTRLNADWLRVNSLVELAALGSDYQIEETGDPNKPYKLLGKRGAEYYLVRYVKGGEIQWDRPLYVTDKWGTIKRLSKFGADRVVIPDAAPSAPPPVPEAPDPGPVAVQSADLAPEPTIDTAPPVEDIPRVPVNAQMLGLQMAVASAMDKVRLPAEDPNDRWPDNVDKDSPKGARLAAERARNLEKIAGSDLATLNQMESWLRWRVEMFDEVRTEKGKDLELYQSNRQEYEDMQKGRYRTQRLKETDAAILSLRAELAANRDPEAIADLEQVRRYIPLAEERLEQQRQLKDRYAQARRDFDAVPIPEPAAPEPEDKGILGTGITVPDVIEVGASLVAPEATVGPGVPLPEVVEVVEPLSEPKPQPQRRGRRKKADMDITADEAQDMADAVAVIADDVGAEQAQLSLFDFDTGETATLSLDAPAGSAPKRGRKVAPPAEPAPVSPVVVQPDNEPQAINININVTDAPVVELAPMPAAVEDKPRKRPAPKQKDASTDSCAPAILENRLEGLRTELALQEQHLQEVEDSTGSKGGISKFERVEKAKKAIGKVKSQITRETKKLSAPCPVGTAGGTAKGGGNRGPAKPKKETAYGRPQKPKGRTKQHPAVKARNDLRREQIANATGR